MAGGLVAAVEVDRWVAEGGESGDVGGVGVVTVGGEVVEGGLGVDGLPQHDDVEHDAQGVELVFLADLVVLAELATMAVEYVAGQAVSGFAAVEQVAPERPHSTRQRGALAEVVSCSAQRCRPAGGCLRTVTSGKVSVCAGPFTADTPRGRELPKDSRPVGWYLSDDVALDIHQDINVAVRTVEDADGAVRLWQ